VPQVLNSPNMAFNVREGEPGVADIIAGGWKIVFPALILTSTKSIYGNRLNCTVNWRNAQSLLTIEGYSFESVLPTAMDGSKQVVQLKPSELGGFFKPGENSLPDLYNSTIAHVVRMKKVHTDMK
jgi:hypothetical protein